MKRFIEQSLLLGGLYFILAYVITYFGGAYASNIDLGVLTLLLITVIVLAYVKSFPLLAKFWEKFPIISFYLAALGVAKYFSIVFGGIPGAIDGYLLASSENSDLYQSYFASYIPIFIVMYWTVFWTALFGATYLAFIKPNMKPKGGKKSKA